MDVLNEDPWKNRRWSFFKIPQMLDLSQKWIVFFIVANAVVLLWLGISWTMHAMDLNEQDAELESLSEEVDWLQERVEWGASYTRTKKAMTWAAAGKMTPRQIVMLSEILWSQSKTYGYDPLLIIAVMHHESRSNPFARGRFLSGTESGALGLMQLKLGTAQVMARFLGFRIQSEADLMKPDVNLALGTYYLLRLIVRYGNVNKGLMAYNIGPYALEKRLRTGERLPLHYSGAILHEYKRLVKVYGDP